MVLQRLNESNAEERKIAMSLVGLVNLDPTTTLWLGLGFRHRLGSSIGKTWWEGDGFYWTPANAS